MNTPARRNMGQIKPTPLGQIRVTESVIRNQVVVADVPL